MAKYTYQQLKGDKWEKRKLLDALKAVKELDYVNDLKDAMGEDRTKPLLEQIAAMEDALNDETKDRSADFDAAMQGLGKAFLSVRHLTSAYEKMRGDVYELDEITESLGLAKYDTAGYIAERQNHMFSTYYKKPKDAVGLESITPLQTYLALHELTKDEQNWKDRMLPADGFNENYTQPLSDRCQDFSEKHFGTPDYYLGELADGDDLFYAIKNEQGNGASVDRWLGEQTVRLFSRYAQEVSDRVEREGLSADPAQRVNDLTAQLMASRMRKLPPEKTVGFAELEQSAMETRWQCEQDARLLTGMVSEKGQKTLIGGDLETLEKVARRCAVGQLVLPRQMEPAPSAKERIEALQWRIKAGHFQTPADKRLCVAAIMAAREQVGAKRGSIFGGADKALDKKLSLGQSGNELGVAEQSDWNKLMDLPDKTIDKLFELAADGHGGKMLEQANKELQTPQKESYASYIDRTCDVSELEPEDVAKLVTATMLYMNEKNGAQAQANHVEIQRRAEELMKEPAFDALMKDPHTLENARMGLGVPLVEKIAAKQAELEAQKNQPAPQPKMEKQVEQPEANLAPMA